MEYFGKEPGLKDVKIVALANKCDVGKDYDESKIRL
jgi:hypothetical protein